MSAKWIQIDSEECPWFLYENIYGDTKPLPMASSLLSVDFFNQKKDEKRSADNFLLSLFNKTNEKSLHHFLSPSDLLTNMKRNSLSTCCRFTNETLFFPRTLALPFWLERADCVGIRCNMCLTSCLIDFDGFSLWPRWVIRKNHILTAEERPETSSQ